MKARMGRKVDFVRLLAREKRKDVAADTGELKFSYSSAPLSKLSRDIAAWAGRTDDIADIFHWVGVPLLLPVGREGQLGEDVGSHELLKVRLQHLPCRLRLDATAEDQCG